VRYSAKGRLTFFVSSMFICVSATYSGYCYWKKNRIAKLCDHRYSISKIIQTGPEKEALPTAYLAEVLNLSTDQPVHLYEYDLKEAVDKLLSSPLIAAVSVKLIAPNALYVDYTVRKPIAWLGDYKNTAIDQDHYLFPVSPFFSPKELPEIFLGLSSFGSEEGGKWQCPMQNPRLDLALEVLQFVQGFARSENLRIKRIDVSNAFAQSSGQREIVICTEEDITLKASGEMVSYTFPKMLRLSRREYQSQMQNFISLKKSMMEDYQKQLSHAALPSSKRFRSRVVDLRIPHLAFVENYTNTGK
jgi:hypothetical protein